jgi:hypothetical protein
MERFIVISGCSGGGKSTLVAEFARRGYATGDRDGTRGSHSRHDPFRDSSSSIAAWLTPRRRSSRRQASRRWPGSVPATATVGASSWRRPGQKPTSQTPSARMVSTAPWRNIGGSSRPIRRLATLSTRCRAPTLSRGQVTSCKACRGKMPVRLRSSVTVASLISVDPGRKGGRVV